MSSKDVSGTVTAVATAVKGGNTNYYIEMNGEIYIASITVSDLLPFVKAGDTVTLTVDQNHNVVAIVRGISTEP